MSYKKTILVALGAFALGFGFSEYRHANQNSDAQQMAGHLPESISVQPALDRPSSPSQVSSVPNTNVQEYLPSRPQTPLERANQLIANGSYGEAAQVLNQLLEQEPKNADALWLLARVYEQQGQHKESVSIWFRYINTEIDVQKIENALDYLAKYLIRLTENPSIFGESYEWLMAQINDLIKLTPANGELHLQLAKMHLKQDDKEQAQYHALMAANQPETRTSAEGILAKLDEGSAAVDDSVPEMTVTLTRFGNQFLVPVKVEGEQIMLLLDTGASISGLTSGFINQHPSLVKSPKPIQLNTASGSVESYLFLVDSFTIENVTFNKHMLARLPMDNMDHFDGLLGIDILGRFDFVIDQNQALLRLRKR
ncbi:tetratricopeptide repeat protein [Cellvibrio sp. NN19]|uniref:tetratricopeptide repeat protein n=1 Tax=Cellvibrio chitinivorans TaxID=3102792 RepID=UPI002B408FDC|nr:tetratricopeptide repeat protein [Cellvibrio sp. NN19]